VISSLHDEVECTLWIEDLPTDSWVKILPDIGVGLEQFGE
jgi:hypothetical protein